MLLRWQRHWWEWTQPLKTVDPEPTVWVDPDLYIEPPRRTARGSIPPPILVGPHSTLRRKAD